MTIIIITALLVRMLHIELPCILHRLSYIGSSDSMVNFYHYKRHLDFGVIYNFYHNTHRCLQYQVNQHHTVHRLRPVNYHKMILRAQKNNGPIWPVILFEWIATNMVKISEKRTSKKSKCPNLEYIMFTQNGAQNSLPYY